MHNDTSSAASPDMEHLEEAVSNKRAKRFKIFGLLFLVGPILLIIITIISFALVNTLLKGIGLVDPSSSRELILKIVNFILGFIGLIAVIALIVGIPLGIYFIVKSKKVKKMTHWDERSGKGDNSEIPEEIRGWNWGAAGLTWIWGVCNEVWMSLLTFIPIISLFFWIILGIKGNEWAWRKAQWESVEQFKKSQKKWKPWGIAFIILQLIPIGFIIIAFFAGFFEALIPNQKTVESSSVLSQVDEYQQSVGNEKIGYSVRYDANRWIVQKNNANETAEYKFSHKDGDVYAVVVAERLQIPLETLKKIAISNAREAAPDMMVLSEEKRIVNGKEMLVMKMKGTIEDIPFIYYGYYFSGSNGAIQFLSYTTPNLFSQYAGDMENLLNGLLAGTSYIEQR